MNKFTRNLNLNQCWVILPIMILFLPGLVSCDNGNLPDCGERNPIGQVSQTSPLDLPETASQGDSYTRESDGMLMYFVPGSTFGMGGLEGDPDAEKNEFPNHEVSLDSFWIDQTEVTNHQYDICVDAGSCRESKYVTNEVYNGALYPVVGVSWQDAQDYCFWVGGRLPTEAEWEYAAKGNTGNLFPWGSSFDGSLLNACDVNCSESWADPNLDDGYKTSAPVGSFPGGASWIGALDMAGNVWEWVEDWCGSYPFEAQNNPTGPEEGECKIIRGGAWASPPAGLRTTCRIIGTSEIGPEIRHPNIGFRCIVSKSNKEFQ